MAMNPRLLRVRLRIVVQECSAYSELASLRMNRNPLDGHMMATIRKIISADRPSVFSNHVMVEKSALGYLVSGASNVHQYVTRLNMPVIKNRDDALRAAMAWAIEHALPEIFLLESEETDQA